MVFVSFKWSVIIEPGTIKYALTGMTVSWTILWMEKKHRNTLSNIGMRFLKAAHEAIEFT